MDTIVLSKNGEEKAVAIRTNIRCRLAGCTGIKFSVRWKDGKLNFLCTKGMKQIDENTWQIV